MSKPNQTSPQGFRVLKQIRALGPFIQASFTITKKRCGNPTCRCASEGPIHESALLTWKEKGTTKTVSIPKELRVEVKAWADEGKRLKQLITKMSTAQLSYLMKLKHNR